MANRLTKGVGLFGKVVAGTVISTGQGQQGSATAGAVGSTSTLAKALTGLADNTATDFFTVTVPNAALGAMVSVVVVGTLGDGDSSDSAQYNIGISRVAGAAAKAVVGAKLGAGATAGATANATVTVTVTAMSGATSGAQTFTIQVKVARSAGAATAHVAAAEAQVINGLGGGVTIA